MRRGIALLLVSACSAAPAVVSAPAATTASSPGAALPPASIASATPAVPASVPVVSSAEPSATASAPAPVPGPPFPPPSVPPPFARSARAGDGEWTALPEAGSLAADSMVRTTVRPHTINAFVTVTVVAVDLRKLGLHLVAGTKEPESKSVPPEKRPGLVPGVDQAGLVAVFNGGFMAKHGKHGMMLAGDVFLPPLPNACTVGVRKDGRVVIGTWTALQAEAESLDAWRQSPPCLVENGTTNPMVRGGDPARKYGMAIDGKMTIRRSAVGVDGSGWTLLVAHGEDVTPEHMAEAMRAAGAVSSAQLDINWSYTRFFLYAHPDEGPPRISATLVPKIKYAPGSYVTDPAQRDFFYLARRKQDLVTSPPPR